MVALSPVALTEEELDGWSDRQAAAMRFAQHWANKGPRARSWLPRQIGRKLGQQWRTAIRTSHGELLAVDPWNLDVYTGIARDGHFTPSVLDACLRLLRPGDVFFDIGANAGFMSVSVGSCYGGDVQVAAFEPQTSLARSIATSVHLNKLENVTVFETMVGAGDGTARLYLSGHSLHASAVARESGAPHLTRPLRRLDTLIAADIVPTPTIMKIDVEGAELDVLRGADLLLRELPPCIILESDENMHRYSYGRHDVLAFLSSRGSYSFHGLRADGALVSVADLGCSDILAIPANHSWRLGDEPRAPGR